MELAKPIRIAFADNHNLVRKGISRLLNSLPTCHVVVEANDGKELIKELSDLILQVDVCILDIGMPCMNGFETLKAIRKRWRAIKVLVLTAHHSPFNLIEMINAGANSYLRKNCNLQELEQALIGIHKHGIYYSDIMNSETFKAVKDKKLKAPGFTVRELSFLKLCCSDLSYRQIAVKMELPESNVESCRESVFKKLNVRNRSSLIVRIFEFGILDIESVSSSLFPPFITDKINP